MNYYEIPTGTFDSLVTEAGLLLTKFDIAKVSTQEAAYTNDDILAATQGGIQISATPTFSDMGEDIDNCPVNMLELKHLDSWECTMSGTMLTVSVASVKKTLAAADVSGNNITLRNDLATTDFTDLWWVGPLADGGCVAVKLSNALSTGGLSLQTGKATKATSSFTFTGHYSISAQDTVPLQVYVIPAA